MRKNIVLIGSGRKGTGKTWKTIEAIANTIMPRDGSAPRKAIAFDTNTEYTPINIQKAGYNFPVKTIKMEQIGEAIVHPKVEFYRIVPVLPTGRLMSIAEKKETAFKILNTFRGGLVILDDINNYVLNVTHEEEFVGTIMNNAHRNADIIINFQSINMVNPILIRNMNWVRMHAQSDAISDKFQEKKELFSIAKYIVDEKYRTGNLYFHVVVNNDTEKIMGQFTRKEFAEACYKYVIRNQKLVRQESYKFSYIRDKKELRIKSIASAVEQLLMYCGI